MDIPNSDMAKQVALAASDFELQRTGHLPKSVTVVLSGETVVITLHGALSPAETALAKSRGRGRPGASSFTANYSTARRNRCGKEIKTNHRSGSARSGRRSRAGVWHRCQGVSTTGTVVQVFLLADSVTARHLEREWSSFKE